MVCRPFVQAMLTLATSKQPLLELRGARGLGRVAFKAPFYCPNANKTLLETKAEIAQAGGIPALIGDPAMDCMYMFCVSHTHAVCVLERQVSTTSQEMHDSTHFSSSQKLM